jgi:UDP-N-acetylmuramate dehydrogenase
MASQQLQTDVSLKQFNTFGVDARARFFARVRSIEQLSSVLADPRVRDLPRVVLGGGSNLLFTGDFDGLVLKIDIDGLRELEPSCRMPGACRWARAKNWHATVQRLLDLKRPGLENLALIPGQCGAAPIQNIGAYGLELAERFDSLRAWDIERAQVVEMSLTDCAFGYRDSVFKGALAGQRIILDVTLSLPREWQPVTGYAELAHELAARGIVQPTAQDVFEAVIAIRRRKLPDPAVLGNAGSFFKNPIVSRDKRGELIARFPSLVNYPLAGGRFKLAAGWLIDAAGLKGATRGRAGVYEKQALVLVNRGGATGSEILALAREIQAKVQEKFGVALEPEPVVI